MTSAAPTIAFFGATGGTANCTLVHALRGGKHVVALARTPSKLTTQLQGQGISESILSSQLTIVPGNALDKDAVKRTLTSNNTPDFVVSHIVTGLGGTPSMYFNWRNPLQFIKLDNPNICADAARTVVAALSELYAENPSLKSKKPTVTFISTTGVSRGPEDVPFGMQIFYHQMLTEPHKDKREMENVFRDNYDGKDEHGPLFADVIGIRPTLLTGGVSADEGVGLDKIRVGTEDEPATGFTINRADVAKWIYENGLNEEKRKTWANQMVSLAS